MYGYVSPEHAKSLYMHIERLLFERTGLEEFFMIRGFLNAREYVIKRIANIIESQMFAPFFDSGDGFNGGGWTPRLPTDSQIVLWVFLQWYL